MPETTPDALSHPTYPRIRLSRFNKAINLTMSRIFKAYGYNITREQEAILRALCDCDGVNQVELSARTGQERNNLSRTLSILESKGFITRVVCTTDRRNSMVYITASGRALHVEVYKAVAEYQHTLFKGLQTRQIQEFADMVHLLTANLEAYLEATDGCEHRAATRRTKEAAG